MPLPRPDDQSADPKWLPPQWLIPKISAVNTWLYRVSDGRVGASAGGMDQLLLTVRGRRSGNVQTVTLPYWVDGDGQPIVVASNGGAAHHPAWFHNVSDREANPTVRIRLGRETMDTEAQVLEGEEHDRIWSELIADRPNYARYQTTTDRMIRLVRITI